MIVFALRHADRTETGDALTDDGVKRAELLARLLAESGVNVAFCSNTVRAHQTLKPLADRVGPTFVVNEVKINGPSEADADEHAEKVVAGLRAPPPKTVAVVVGHTTTVDKVIKKLTGKTVDKIKDEEFDKLFVVLVSSDGASTVALMRYGAPTPPPPHP